MEVASAVFACLTLLSDTVRSCYSSAETHRTRVRKLASDAETLKAQREDVERRKEEARDRGDIVNREAVAWLAQTEELLRDHTRLGDESGCFGRCKVVDRVRQLAPIFGDVLAKGPPAAVSGGPDPALGLWRPTRVSAGGFELFSSTEAALNRLMAALAAGGEDRVVGVHGLPGVGKTTLAQKAAERALQEKLFGRVVFFTVAKDADEKKIQDAIAEQLGIRLGEDQSQQRRAGVIRGKIEKERKVLIVADDLWVELDLSKIGVPCGSDLEECDSKVVFTTRNKHVLQLMSCENKISLDVWSQQESRCFLKKTSRAKFDNQEFEEIADSVADECKGLPLALVVVAKALGDKPIDEWNSALARLRKSMTVNSDDSLRVFFCIKLSYDYLGDDEKMCFLMCCLFPEDHSIGKEELARYMFGLGVFGRDHSLEEARADTNTIALKLKESALLLPGDRNNKTVKMHDVLRDFAIQIAHEKRESFTRENEMEENRPIFVVQVRDADKPVWSSGESYDDCTAISAMFCGIPSLPNNSPSCSKLKTLLLQDNKSLEEIPSTFFENMKALRVLDLSRTGASSLPSSIAGLEDLRTLHLDICKFLDVSVLGALNRLAILSLRQSVIVELPADLGKLSNLRMLDLTLSSSINRIPPNVLSGMCNLKELYLNASFAQWHDEDEEVPETSRNASFSELTGLHYLSVLDVDVYSAACLPKHPRKLPGWKKFNICLCREVFTRLANVHSGQSSANYTRRLLLDTSTKSLPSWFNDAVSKNTEKLTYYECTALNMVEDYGRGVLSGLKSLVVEYCSEVDHLMRPAADSDPSRDGTPLLEGLLELRVHQMDCMKGICDGDLPEGSFKSLKLLEVQQCHEMQGSLLTPSLIKTMLSLERLRACGNSVTDVFDLENLPEGRHLGSLRELRLGNLPKVGTISKGPARFADFTKLRLVSVFQCEKLLNLFPIVASEGLSELEDLWVEQCREMKSIFPNREIDGAPERVNLPKLKTLCLIDLPKLSSFCTGEALLEFPSLEHLYVSQCTEFKTPAVSELHSTKEVLLNDEQHMKMLRERMIEQEY